MKPEVNFVPEKLSGIIVAVSSNKWVLESYVPKPFFWYSEPFKSSSASGFIKSGIKLRKDFKELLLIDCDEILDFKKWMFDLEKKIFYTSSLEKTSEINSAASDITVFYDSGVFEKIKENYEMCDFS